MALFMAIALLLLEPVSFPGHQLGEQGVVGLPVIRVSHFLPFNPADLCFAEAPAHLSQGRIAYDGPALQIGHGNADGRPFEHGPETGLALPQGLFGALAGRNVFEDSHGPVKLAGRVIKRGIGQTDVDQGAILS